MTSKLTIARERLEKIKSWSETYGAGSNVMLPVEEAEGLARIALAAMDSEPVFTLEVARADYKGQKLGNHFGFITLDAARELKEGNYQLYAAQQPVVPDAYVRDERGRMMLNGVCEPKIGFGTGWNACRAAMLNGVKS
ncbi:TPA: hypothetical protein ACQJI7_003921 [Klebsiella pneumoniae]